MAALLGADLAQAQELAKAAAEGEVCEAANDNAPGQVVISGAKTAIDRAVALAPKFGARRAVLLPVSAPFHCALMQPAADVDARQRSPKLRSMRPRFRSIANVLATPITDPEAIRARLVEQVTGMVRWRETMLYLKANGVGTVYEVGAGRVLTGIARRFEGIEARSIGTPEELEAASCGACGLTAFKKRSGFDVRPDRKRRARHRRQRRDRLGHRQGSARPRRQRCDLRDQGGEARCPRRGAWLSRVFALPCDLRDRAAVVKLGEEAEKALGQVDILVNNAGITHDNLFMRMKDEEWDDVIAVNLTSVFVLTRTILRNMMRRRAGRIVNIASISGVLGNPGQPNYAASKAGLVGMTKSLAREVASRGITANCIAPGFIKTPMTDALTPKQIEAIAAAIPTQTFGKPEDIAATVVFLASSEAAYITGETVHVNGGMVMV